MIKVDVDLEDQKEIVINVKQDIRLQLLTLFLTCILLGLLIAEIF